MSLFYKYSSVGYVDVKDSNRPDWGMTFTLQDEFGHDTPTWAAIKDQVANGTITIQPADPVPPAPAPVVYGQDASTRDQIVDGVSQLRQYLALASPTAAQSAGALKLLIRLVLFLAQRVVS